MLPECTWYCRDTYATNFRINLQIINNKTIEVKGVEQFSNELNDPSIQGI